MFAGKLLFTFGVGMLIMGGYQSSLLLRGTKVAEVVSIDELGRADGTNNVHLTVTDFAFGEYIVTYKKDGSPQRAWFPLLTKDGKWTDRPVVLHSKHCTSPTDITNLIQQKSVTGVVSNFMQSLGSFQRDQFAKIYPNDDLQGAIALELDATLPSPWIAFPLFFSGVLATALGCRSLFRALFPTRERSSETWEGKSSEIKLSNDRF